MRIFLLTPIYATTTKGSGATPVVHYFAKEWVKQGHEVYVFNLIAKFPSLYYWISNMFQHQLNTRLGMLVPIEKPVEGGCIEDGVKVSRVCLKKIIPHSKYNISQIEYAIKVIQKGCLDYGVPDVFVGHWDNPQLEILIRLKELYHSPVALVFHNNVFNLEQTYGDSVLENLKELDIIGFRSIVSKKNFEMKYFKPKNSFVASSGVSENFINAGKEFTPSFKNGIHNFVFVGSLIARKYPSVIIEALSRVYENKDFHVTFIGDGCEKEIIENNALNKGIESNVFFTGRIGRNEIIEHLKKAEVFIMISRDEIFGLVYLEAMALGLIPVGSKNEGIDGIIEDGKNGFLCKAGDVDELTDVLRKMCNISIDELVSISQKAKKTANEFTDSKVAVKYINNLKI